MIAFVLSGGGNRGAAQAGAIRALLERGIRPDLLVGTSVGSLSAAALAYDPTIEGARRAVALWRRVRREDVFPGNALTVGWRVLTRQGGLHSRENFARFLRASFPPDLLHFGDLRARCLVTATVLGTCRLRLFGLDPQDSLVDALLASTAIPPFFAPHRVGDEWLVDGAVVANLPLALAAEHGARTIYALQIVSDDVAPSHRSLANILSHSLSAMLSRHDELEHRLAALGRRGIRVHPIRLAAGQDLAYNDFRHTASLIEAGYRAAEAYLDALPAPSVPPHRRVAGAVRAAVRQLGARRAAAPSNIA